MGEHSRREIPRYQPQSCVLRFVDDFLQLIKALLMDDRSDEVVELFWPADLQLLCLFDQTRLDGRPGGFGKVTPARGTALLTLVFEGAADGVDDDVLSVGAVVDTCVWTRTRVSSVS